MSGKAKRAPLYGGLQAAPAPQHEPCYCVDYEPVDPDDSLCSECTCGHVVEEHGSGFFRRCKFTPDEAES